MYALGYDLGSSSVKAAIVELSSGKVVCRAQYPKTEMPITSLREGWAEQDPNMWWEAIKKISKSILNDSAVNASEIRSIGIAYQMHGLVLLDKEGASLRPSIIWCDSRAVIQGAKARKTLGDDYCFENLLNSPGNFTASKLKWVKENEPAIFEKIYKVMLPGDFIAYKFTGMMSTTISGLSEGIMWDFKSHSVSKPLLDVLDISMDLIPKTFENFSLQGEISSKAAIETGLEQGTPISYRGGDQPNNALSLHVMEPGEIAATGGTSGVVYGISDQLVSDPESRINSFAHLNHSQDKIRIGQLLCINGAGSQYAWIRNQLWDAKLSYNQMEEKIAEIPTGSDGLRILPFGNGAERIMQNKNTGAQINNLQFNRHTKSHLIKAALEGIAFSFVKGILILQELGLTTKVIKVANDNLFQSKTFTKTIANLTQCSIDIIETNGAIGAAKASGFGIGYYKHLEQALAQIKKTHSYEGNTLSDEYLEAYKTWEFDYNYLCGKPKSRL